MRDYKEITLQISTGCTLQCPYCFAGNYKENKKENFINEEDVNSFIEFCRNNNIDLVRITGGEPFLYPKFEYIINKLEDISLNVFTNLTVADSVKKISNHKGGVGCLVNVNERKYYSERLWMNLINNLESLYLQNMTCVLGFNIFRRNFDISEIVKLAKKYRHNRFRISIANPIVNGNNQYLPASEISYVGRRLVDIHKELSNDGIECTIDCLIAPCLLECEVCKYMVDNNMVRFECMPMSFFTYDLKLSHCYATQSIESTHYLKEFKDYDSVVRMSENMVKMMRKKAVHFEKCSSCSNPYKVDLCGCFGLYKFKESCLNG